jgi:ATP-dependent DNA ligase
MTSKQFPTLYGVDKKGKLKQWTIRTDNLGHESVITCSYGYINGRHVESKQTVSVGKNIGKVNSTTHFQQAVMDAESKWNKKKTTDGYTTSIGDANATRQDSCCLPMLAQEYKKHSSKVQYPCYIQPKLDGYRMIYTSATNKCTSRTGKEYAVLYGTQLFQELRNLPNIGNICLDGELYLHGSELSFEDYGILRKQKVLSEQERQKLTKIEYHIYDVAVTNMCFSDRKTSMERIQQNISTNNFPHIKFVDTYTCKDNMDIDKYHQQFMKDGYEGSIVRNANGLYKSKYRSFDLLKKKDFDDAEFMVVGFTEETDTSGKNKPLVVWICETEAGQRFNVQSKGTKESRKDIYKEATKYVGKRLWVQYFGRTVDGIPRFPKTMREGLESIRDNVC